MTTQIDSDLKNLLVELGDNIRSTRMKKRISTNELADISGVTQGNISRIERGQNTTIASLYKICDALKVDPSDLLP